MRNRLPTRPSGRLIALLLAITVVPLVSLVWLGWKLLEEDRNEIIARESRALTTAADAVTSALDRAIAIDDQRAAGGADKWEPGAVVVTFTGSRLDAVPRRLAYYPVMPKLPETAADAFDAVDRAEFQLREPKTQIDLLERLVTSADPVLSATAKYHLFRVLESQGQHDRAFRLSEPLLEADRIGVATTPIALATRFKRCQALELRKLVAALQQEAEALHRDLTSGRWTLDASTYELYLGDARRWLKLDPKEPTVEERLAGAAAVLWRDRSPQIGRTASLPQRQTVSVGSDVFTVLWQPRPGSARALIATADYARTHWLARAVEAGRGAHVEVTVPALSSTSIPPDARTEIRTADATNLPWDFAVTRAPGAVATDGRSRRPFLLGGLAILMVMALTASYFIARAVHREIAVARMQSDFVAAVSHEFRTPLTTLRQFTDMLREGGATDEERRQLCYDAQSRATTRLTNLVESVLDFGRMEAGKRPYRFESVSCSEVVEPVVSDFQREIQTAGYRIEYHADESADIDADPEALGRALRNLLENAVKYSPDQRTVEVAVTRQPSSVSIAVTDRGIGVHASEKKAIFDQFHRGTEARTRGIAGTGIGLAMVDHIVRAHRGSVQVESEPGKGSTFTIVLPVRA